MIREQDLNLLYKRAKNKVNHLEECEKQLIPNSYVIKLTTDCNMKCDYCYMGESTLCQRMSVNLFEKILNEVSSASTQFTIYLHGGEPCLRIDLLEKLDLWIKQNSMFEKVNVMLQTNGTVLTKELMGLIKSMRIKVGISVDGVDDIANSARSFVNGEPTTNNVLTNIDKLLENDIEVGIFSVLTSKNCLKIVDLFSYFTDRGVHNFVVNPLVLWGRAVGKRELMAKEHEVYESYKLMIDWIGNYNAGCSVKERVQERNLHWWYKGIVEGEKGYMCNCSPCGAGLQTIAIGPTGNVYLCDQYYGDEKFYVGNLDEMSLSKVVKATQNATGLIRNIYDINECKKCEWRYVCSGGCSATSYYYSGNMNSVSPYCEAYKKIFSYIDMKLQNDHIIL